MRPTSGRLPIFSPRKPTLILYGESIKRGLSFLTFLPHESLVVFNSDECSQHLPREREGISYTSIRLIHSTWWKTWFLIGFLPIRVTFHFYHKNNAFKNAHGTRDCELSNYVNFYNSNARLWLRMSSNHLTIGERQKGLLSSPELPFMPKAPFLLSIPRIVRVFYSCFYLWFYCESTIFFLAQSQIL